MTAQRKMFEAEAEVVARNGNRRIPTLLIRRSINNLNLTDFNYTKQVDGQIRLREIKLACVENWH